MPSPEGTSVSFEVATTGDGGAGEADQAKDDAGGHGDGRGGGLVGDRGGQGVEVRRSLRDRRDRGEVHGRSAVFHRHDGRRTGIHPRTQGGDRDCRGAKASYQPTHYFSLLTTTAESLLTRLWRWAGGQLLLS